MNKNLLILTTLAAALASCSSDDLLVDENSSAGNGAEIKFETYTPNMTRATGAENSGITDKTALENHHDNFYVWASKNATTYQTVWAADAPATVKYSSSAWTATPSKFWDKSASYYYFYAAAPKLNHASSQTALNWTLTWKNATSGSEDYSDAYISLANYTLKGDNISTVPTSAVGTAAVAATITSGVTLYDASGNEVAADNIVAGGTYYTDASKTTTAIKGTNYTEPVAASADYSPANVANKNIATTFSGTVNDLDLMIANACPVQRSATTYNQATPAKVNLEFDHILSRLNILVKKGTSVTNSTVNLTGLTVYNLKNKGTFTENTSIDADADFDSDDMTELAKGTVKRWGTPSAVKVGSPEVDYAPTAVTFNGVDETPRYVLETLIIPQNITYQNVDVAGYQGGTTTKLTTTDQVYLRIDYKIDGEDFYGYYNLAKAFGANTTGATVPFNEGWQNNLTITINPSLIEFDAEVFNWKNGTTNEINVPD